jgi:hypothetical protein
MTETLSKVVITSESVEIVPLSAKELAHLKNVIDESKADKTAEAKTLADKTAAKAKLEALGLTTEDLKALGL